MTYENEDVQGKFHGLATETQVNIAQLEQDMNEIGMMVHVADVVRPPPEAKEQGLEIVIRIY